MEARYQGFVSRVVVQLLRGADMIGSNLQKAVKEIGEEAEKGLGIKTIVKAAGGLERKAASSRPNGSDGGATG